MEVCTDYNKYISSLKETIEKGSKQVDFVFSGEWSVLKIVEKYQPQGDFYCLDFLDNERALLMKVSHSQESLHIIKTLQWEFSIHKIAVALDVFDSEEQSAVKWWNLCFHRNREGVVFYDDYYDTLYASNCNNIMFKNLREELEKAVAFIPEEIVGRDLYLLKDFANFNPLIYMLQCRGCKVVSVLADELPDSEEFERQLLLLKRRMERPCCDNRVCSHCFYNVEGVAEIPVTCGHPYPISFPCKEIEMDTIAFGDYSIKDILPNGEVRRDYECCGEDYMYIEQTFYADLFGNTFLKCVNSDEVGNNQRMIVLNEVAFNNLNLNE